MKKSKKGSSLILVLVLFSVLSIVGMAMISVANSNYKVRILKGNIKTNMYASESGIDEAYGIIGNTVDKAISEGNSKVKEYMDKLDLNKEVEKKKNFLAQKVEMLRIQDKINELDSTYDSDEISDLQKQLDNIINNPESDTDYVKDDLSINIEKIKTEQNDIFKSNYKFYITSKLSLIDLVDYSKKDNLIAVSNNEYILSKPKSKELVVYVENFDKVNNNISFNNNDILTINLKSVYNHKNIEKIIKADYDVFTPDYKGAFCVENNKKKINENIVWSKAICADGNMEIKDNGQVAINGSIYIKGNNTLNNSGINIRNHGVTITGDISTANDVKLDAVSNNTSINGNIYAKNIILTEKANDSRLTLRGSAYTTDDLELNSEKKGVIDINGDFYGLEQGDNSKTPDASSSIIINSDDLGLEDGSSLRIGGKSIIMGTSYIDTSPDPYQTGESLSIKGNYKAYMEPLTDINEDKRLQEGRQSLKEENIIFSEQKYQPLMPVYTFKNKVELDVFDKIDYFRYYIEQKHKNGEANELKTKGVNIDWSKSYCTGAIIGNNGKWEPEKTNLDIKEMLNKKKYEYNKMVYYMGDSSVKDEEIKDANLQPIYVSTQLNLDKISSDANLEKDKYMLKTGNYTLIFPNSSANLPSEVPESNKIILNSNEYKGIIIINGDLYICGEMNFTGTIICTGSVHIMDDKNKNIIYSEDIVKKVIATNYDVFKAVFNNSGKLINVAIDAKISEIGNSSLIASDNTVIKLKNWTLVK